MRAALLLLVGLLLTGCETVETAAPSPLFDQALVINGHYNLVYPKGK